MIKKSVLSSHIESVAYDRETQELHVYWQKGKNRHSIYSSVPESKALLVINSWSVGESLNAEVKKGPHPHRYGD